MKLAAGILVMVGATAASFAQNPNIIQNTRNKLNVVSQQQTAARNNAFAAAGSQAPATHPQQHVVQPAHAHAHVAKPVAARIDPAAPRGPAKAKRHEKEPVVAVAEQKPPAADNNADADKDASKKTYTLSGKRDPFLSPVVSRMAVGSGCSVGKKCLAIDQISLRGVVKSDSGMIAVVVNALDKAYFLHENDPVFNGYVVRITGDSIIFKETVQDRLGKPVVREVTKKITTPAV